MTTFIKGTYYDNIYFNESNGYTVGLFKVIETNDEEMIPMKGKIINFVGNFYDLKIKSNYRFQGNVINHPKYGTQYKVEEYTLILPTENDELVTFLSSELFPIGETTAKKIVDKYQDKTLEIIKEHYMELITIPRINEQKAEKIHNILEKYQNSSDTVLYLTKLGFNTKNALTILYLYNDKSKNIIDQNIYQIIEEIPEISFKSVDEIALKNGYEINDERRILSLIIHIMTNKCFESGDTYLYLEEIHELINFITKDELEYFLNILSKKHRVVIKKEKYYLKSIYDDEITIKERLCYLNNIENKKKKTIETYLKQIEETNKIKYDTKQKEAIIKAVSNNLTIITGGPGTGKTTIVKAIVNLLTNYLGVKAKEIALLAPTGRASKKMCENIKLSASTIHRYLKWDKESNSFQYDENNQTEEEYIIVDEVSMIDNYVMSSLLKGLKKDIKLVLVGDYYQLPSVREGQVLKDIIDSNMFNVIKLDSLYRQNENSYIYELAEEIRNKELSPNFTAIKSDYNFIELNEKQILPYIKEIIEKAREKGYQEPDIQVMAPMYKTLNGIDNLNKILQNIFNPPSAKKQELQLGEIIYREGDKILQLVNDPDNNVYNGDIGYITEIISSKKSKSHRNEIVVEFELNKVTYTPANFINITHGYAISVHKAQGSEFKMVIIPFSNSFKRMLYNKLIYTGITRAREYLILLGDPKLLEYSVYNDYDEIRKTTLQELIIDEYKKKK